MKYRGLGMTGLQVSVLGFGASPLGGGFGAIDEAEGIRSVHAAIDLGINFIDVSPYYGLTKAETVLGKALKELPRDAYCLATKVGRYGLDQFDFSTKRVVASIDESLTRLNVDYIDLIQCHDIEFGSLDQIIEETLPALGKVQKQGKVRFIGISGLPLAIFRYVLDRTQVDTVLSYCHYCLNDTALQAIIPYLQGKQVGIINASPLAMGLLTERGAPAWHLASPRIKAVCAEAVRFCRQQGADISQLAMQFSLANPDVATTLVGIADTETLKKNVRCLETPPHPTLLAEVQAILAPIHNESWPSGRPENSVIPSA